MIVKYEVSMSMILICVSETCTNEGLDIRAAFRRT